ncbi:MAG: hypothetical protein ACRCYP_07190, partial [Alphaproteobacteria bacterium]
ETSEAKTSVINLSLLRTGMKGSSKPGYRRGFSFCFQAMPLKKPAVKTPKKPAEKAKISIATQMYPTAEQLRQKIHSCLEVNIRSHGAKAAREWMVLSEGKDTEAIKQLAMQQYNISFY